MRQKSTTTVKRYGGKLAKKGIHHSRKGVQLAAKGSRTGVRHAKRVAAVGAVHAARGYRVAHHHLAQRPHQTLVAHVSWYRRWHEWHWHRLTHYAALSLYVLAIGAVLFNTFRVALAADLTNLWDFSTPSDYSLSDSSAVEVSGNTARMKAQNYTSDSNTKALYHLDDGSGSSLSDSSGSANPATATGSPSWVTGNLNGGLSLNGTTQYASASDSASLSLTQDNTLEAWTKFSSGFGANTHDQQQGILDKGSYKLYYNHQTGKVTYELANSGATTWTQQGGGDLINGTGADIKGSWDANGKNRVEAQVTVGTDVYVGLGFQTSDAEVWKLNTTTNLWTQVGGDGVNSSWANGTYEEVLSLASDGTNVYAGIGNTTNDAEVWRLSSGSWTKVGGDGVNSSWNTNYETVSSLAVNGTTVYAGLGNSAAGDAEVWRCTSCSTSPSWGGSLIGGDGVNSSWANSTYELVVSMVLDGSNNPIVGLGNGTGDGEIWACTANCGSGTPTWSKIGGDGTGPSGAIEVIQSMTMMGGNLYVGTGNNTAGDGKVYRYASSVWTQVGGDTNCGGTCTTTWPSNYETVRSLISDGTYIYAGLGDTAGDNEVWKCTGCSGGSATWTQIGGDGSGTGGQSWTTAQTYAQAMSIVGTKLYVGISHNGSSTTDGQEWSCDLAVSCTTTAGWSKIGGNYVNKSWGYFGFNSIESMTVHNGYLYAGTGYNGNGNAMVWRFDGSTWTMVGGQGLNSSWAADTFRYVSAMASFGGNLYVGIDPGGSNAAVWKCTGCDGSSPSWTQVGGGGSGSGGQSWTTAAYARIQSMAVYGGKLYIGPNGSAGAADVWQCTGSCTTTSGWSQIGGDTLNSSWASSTYESVWSMTVMDGYLMVGLGTSTNDAEIWRYNGSTWGGSRIGGKGTNSSWNTDYEYVDSMVTMNNKLYVGLASTAGDGEVWQCTGCDGGSPSWTKIGGDSNGSDNLGWADATYERVRSLAVYNGELYAGLGLTSGDGEVWKYDGTTWTKIGGDNINGGWTGAIENVSALQTYQGKLFAGTGDTSNGDAMVWSYGNNYVLESSATSQDTNWHHIAASYDGTTMKIYIDGVLNSSATVNQTMPDNSYPLLIGTTYGSTGAGQGQGTFAGSLDEIRISDTGRTSFTTKPYSTTPQTVKLASSVRTSGVLSWDGLNASQTLNGGTIKYRLSDDGGSTWKYWTGSSWGTSSSTSDSNAISTINSNIGSFPVSFGGIMWQAILTSDGTQQVTLNSVTLTANSDNVEPSANASSIQAYKSNGGASLVSNGWTNGSSPYFSWTAGADAGSGIKGYCLYLGTDNTADPVTTKGMLGTSPVTTGGHCQFLISGTNVDLATAGYLNTALTTSSSPYYLRIKAMDNAGNVYSTSTAQFQFRFDNTPPTNPSYITAPSGFINTKTTTFSWPTAGGQAPADSNSGIAGLQYRVNNTTWYGDGHTGSGDINDLLTNDGAYTTVDPPDFDNINEGVNTVYFRTWDQAGNVTSSYVSAALKINTNGAPTEPQNVIATPSTNTTNAFAFDWDQPATFVGDAGNLTYCYTINTLPSANTCTFTSAGVTSLGSGPYATQPGTNTFYVVAKDESSNINYANYASTTFNANTSAPGIPTNTDIVDVSIKSTNSWRLALTWDEPANPGTGIASYKVYRSTNNVSFSFVGSSSSTTYIDSGLSQQTYYYRVRACDSTNNCGADSSTVHMLPTGKFTTPADMTSEPTVSNITTKRARITWSTDRGSDSKILIGTTSGQYSPSEIGNSNQVTAHTIDLDNLAAGTTYYFKARWTDEDGNTATSQEYSFTTSPAPQLKEVVTLKTTLTGAIIQFSTKDATKANLYFGKSDAFGGVKSVNTSTSESTYSIELTGLDDGAKYYYKISTFDDENGEYQGTIFSFTTPARPRISNLKFQPVQGEPTSTQRVTWDTNVPTTTTVTYGKLNTSGTDIQQSQLVTAHEVVLRQLEDDSQYFLIASGRDGDGNLSTSDRQQFHTALDTRPPKVTEIVTEPSIKGSGAEARGQIVVSWKTDEPSTSQVAYAEGSASTNFNNKTAEDSQLTTEHLVIVSDLPTSRVFSIQPVSKDKAGNAATGESQSAIIGRASDSVLTIILNTLKRVFGI